MTPTPVVYPKPHRAQMHNEMNRLNARGPNETPQGAQMASDVESPNSSQTEMQLVSQFVEVHKLDQSRQFDVKRPPKPPKAPKPKKIRSEKHTDSTNETNN